MNDRIHDSAAGPITDGAERLIAEIKRSLRWLQISVCVLFVLLAATVGYFAYKSEQSHNALCTFRGDLQDRVAQSKDILAHPENYPPAFTDKQTLQLIATNLPNQERVISALGGLNCG